MSNGENTVVENDVDKDEFQHGWGNQTLNYYYYCNVVDDLSFDVLG